MAGTKATEDRGEVMHFAGFHHLSPALDDQVGPAFFHEGSGSEGLVRCGWARFFEAMREHQAALVYDAEDPSSARFVRKAEGRSEGGHHSGFARSVEHAKRFMKAFRSA